jgi:hypothetical protein
MNREGDAMLTTDDMRYDTMIVDHDHFVTHPPMTWLQVLEWLLAHGYEVLAFPTEMVGGCVISQRVRSVQELLEYHRNRGVEGDARPDDDPAVICGNGGGEEGVRRTVPGSTYEPDLGLYVVESGTNGHGKEVAWVYDSNIPMEDWHTVYSGVEFDLKPGAEEPDEYEWSHWAHCALGMGSEGFG